MTTTAVTDRGSDHLDAMPAGEVNLDFAEWLAIQQTPARYTFALDHGDLVALEGVLTEDTTWAATVAGETRIGPFVGRAAVLDFVRAATEAQTGRRRHHVTNIVLRRADADTAVLWAYLLLTSNTDGNPTVVTTGFYTFTLRHAEGGWRIADLFIGLDSAV